MFLHKNSRAAPALIAGCLLLAASAAAPAETRPGRKLAIAEAAAPAAGVGDQFTGDLWPSCWSDDDELYAAVGDGRGFNAAAHIFDVAVTRISGTPPRLKGRFLAGSDQVASLFGAQDRKPSGMLCRGGRIDLAVQEMTQHHAYAESASISVSSDHGKTWTWDRAKPLFDDHVFTTIFFLDFGKDSRHAIDGHVYAYGLDGTWSSRHELFLGRVPKDHVRERKAWTFFAGRNPDGSPKFTPDIRKKAPVLVDRRALYPGAHNYGPIAQGSVVYLPAFKRYLYTSWTELTHEFYEAPKPWGPWTLSHHVDFGPYPWRPGHAGGYAATIPSKFISADGRTMWLQSNCFGKAHNCSEYFFSLRRLLATPR